MFLKEGFLAHLFVQILILVYSYFQKKQVDAAVSESV